MPETIAVTFTRAEYEAMLRATEKYRHPLHHGYTYGPTASLHEMDLRDAARTLEAAGRVRPMGA